MKKHEAGFTLVELSIVLVIIGLIVSSVLVGQDLIRQAELRGTVTQYEQFNAAVNTFRTKYGGVPGDTTAATDFGFTGDGDADGILADSAFTAGYASDDERGTMDGELVYFWNHLGASGAGLVNGDFGGVALDNDASSGAAGHVDTTVPQAKAGGYWAVISDNGINYFFIGVTTDSDNDAAFNDANGFTPLEAQSLDTKIDDGRPTRGIARASDAAAATIGADPGSDSADECVSDGSNNPYLTTDSDTLCTMKIRFN